MKSIRKVVVLGANGAMGSGSAAVFAAAGIRTTLLARTIEKAAAGRARVEQLAGASACVIDIGTYGSDFAIAVGQADLVLEAITEDVVVKRDVFALIDRVKAPGTIVATVSSGLSIATLCAGRSDEFRRHFLGVHLFNPPTVIVGCELIPHRDTHPVVVEAIRTLLATTLGRAVVECADTPAFAGNRIGFKVLNEIAQLAEDHGVAYMDQLVGAHTGRALAPLATIDLVGWDVHKAIVDNLWWNTADTAHACFELPSYIERGVAAGRLGRKTRDKGGFFRIDGKGETARRWVLDPATDDYRPLAEMTPPLPALVERMKAAIRAGGHTDALDALCCADDKDAVILRRVMLGYISYGLGLVGEVVAHARDIDRIMGFGFQWAPPSMLADGIGAARTIELLDRAMLPVPAVLVDAARTETRLFDEPDLHPARFFVAA